MFNKFFALCFFVLFTLVTISVSNVDADEPPYIIPENTDIYADAHGDANAWNVGAKIHLHGVVYAEDDPDSNSRTGGYYTIALTVSEPKKGEGKWGRANFDPNVILQDSFSEGVHQEGDLSFTIEHAMRVINVGWTASANMRIVDSGGNVVHNPWDYDEKEIGEWGENDTWKDAEANASPTPGIYLADANQIPQPGDSATLNLVTSEPYYVISLYVHTPWDTSSSGTFVENVSGDGTSTETSFSYTFPSGAMHTGDFQFRAVIYRWSDMSSYEETCTVTVDMTPNCDNCTDGNSNCPNASAH